MTDHITHTPPAARRRRLGLALVAAGLLAAGGATGAVVASHARPSVTMAPAVPVAIRSLADTAGGDREIVTIRGRVAEVFGNKFILADASGRALVDTGRVGEDSALVAPGAPVTVQGRFDHGFIHAAFLVDAAGKVSALRAIDGPGDHHGPRHGPDHGPDRGPGHGPGRDAPGRGGPDGGPDGRDGPPPPPPAPIAATTPGHAAPVAPAAASAPVG